MKYVLVKDIGLDKKCTIPVRTVGASIARPPKINDFRMMPGKICKIFAFRRRILPATKSADDDDGRPYGMGHTAIPAFDSSSPNCLTYTMKYCLRNMKCPADMK